VKEARSSAHHRLPAPGGYSAAYAGLLLFTMLLYVRPNELLPIGTFPIVKIVAILTLVAFFFQRLSDGGSISVMPRTFRYLLILTGLMLLSIPVALDPGASLAGFLEAFSKIVLIFLLIINVVTSFRRLRLVIEVMVLSGSFVAVATLIDFSRGVNLSEGFRAAGAVGGLFGNPNDLALAMNVLIPLAIGLVLSHSTPLAKPLYFVCTGLFVVTTIVTYSRAGFVTLAIMSVVLLAQIGRRHRAAWGVGGVALAALLIVSPGTFWNRITTLFEGAGTPGVSAAESATMRWELVKRSIEVAGFNPIRWSLGVGIDNFHIVSHKEFVNHNAYLQVFNEVGLPALIVYILFLISAIRITNQVINRFQWVRGYRRVWFTAIAIQGSLVAYAVGSLFASVAFLWYVYYPAAFAICLHQLVARVRTSAAPEKVTSRVWYLRRAQH
jgi:hypothetical protein